MTTLVDCRVAQSYASIRAAVYAAALGVLLARNAPDPVATAARIADLAVSDLDAVEEQ